MRKKKMKMDEDQYQLGIRKLSPHEMVTLIVGYRNDVLASIRLFKQLLESDTSHLNAIQKELLKVTVANLEERATDFNILLED